MGDVAGAAPTTLDDLAATSASFGRGLELTLAAIERDGALTARDKAILLVGATAVGDPSSTGRAVERARLAGVEQAELHAVALGLVLSRGLGPARAVLGALDPPPPSQDDVGAVSRREVVDAFTAVFGELPDRVRLLDEHLPDGLEAYHRMRVAALRDSALDPVVAELVLFCVNAADHRADYATVHARGARSAGATEAQLVEAGWCAVPVGGVAAWLAASTAIVDSRQAVR